MTKVAKDKVKNGQLIDIDIDLFHKGKNYSSYRFMGAHLVTEKRKRGIRLQLGHRMQAKSMLLEIFVILNQKMNLKWKRLIKEEYGQYLYQG